MQVQASANMVTLVESTNEDAPANVDLEAVLLMTQDNCIYLHYI